MDLRERVVARVEKGETVRSVAEAFGISPSCVSKWGSLKRRTGDVAPGQVGGHKKRALSGEIAAWLRQRMKDRAFTLRGLVAELAERGVKSEARAVWVFVHDQGLSYKKNSRGGRAIASRRRAQAGALEGAASRRRR
jgi:putative transposase